MLLPKKEDKILGIPNRWVIAIGGSVFCVFVEYLLNSVGALTWDYPWWNRGAPWLDLPFRLPDLLHCCLLGVRHGKSQAQDPGRQRNLDLRHCVFIPFHRRFRLDITSNRLT